MKKLQKKKKNKPKQQFFKSVPKEKTHISTATRSTKRKIILDTSLGDEENLETPNFKANTPGRN